MALGTGEIDYCVKLRTFKGEPMSGDGGLVAIDDGRLLAALIDVAGHGKSAAELARKVEEFILLHSKAGLLELVNLLHQQFRGSRGFVGSFCTIDLKTGTLKNVSVGNIRMVVLGDRTKRFISQEGIIGYTIPLLQERVFEMRQSDVLVIYTDGIKEFFEFDSKFSIAKASSHDIATNLIEQFGKSIDDSGCIVIKSFKWRK